MTLYTVTVNGVTYSVEAVGTLDGRYEPATRENPESHPDLLIEVGTVYDDDGKVIDVDDSVIGLIYDALYDTASYYNDLYERAAKAVECQEPDEDLHPSRGER